MTYATAKDSKRSFYLLLDNKLLQEFNIHMHFVKVLQISGYFFNVNLHKNCICAFFFMHVIIKGMMGSSCLPLNELKGAFLMYIRILDDLGKFRIVLKMLVGFSFMNIEKIVHLIQS